MAMIFDVLKVDAAYTRDDLGSLWRMHLPTEFFVERDGRVALFATQLNDGGKYRADHWANALDVVRREFIAEVNPERADKNQRIREATDIALFYRMRSPDAFVYKGKIRHRTDEKRGATLYLVMDLLDGARAGVP